MTNPHTLIADMAREWEKSGDTPETLATAILEELPGMVPARKWGPMEWEKDEFGCDEWGEFRTGLVALSACSCYAIYKHSTTQFMWVDGTLDNIRYSTYRDWRNPTDKVEIPWHPSIESAQDAANAHHRATWFAALQEGE